MESAFINTLLVLLVILQTIHVGFLIWRSKDLFILIPGLLSLGLYIGMAVLLWNC